MYAQDGTMIVDRWIERYGNILLAAAENGGEYASDEDAELLKAIEEISRAEKVLEDVVYGNDIAHDRKHTLDSWPDSTFRKRAIAILFPPAPEQPSAEKAGE